MRGTVREWFHAFDDSLWIWRKDRTKEAAFLADALGLRRGTSVLDAPCGDGAVAFELARLGVHVTGVDLRDNVIRRARATFATEELRGRFLVGDLRELRFADEFDAAFNWYGSFGYFADEAENLAVLQGLARAVRRGGLVLVDQPNRERMLRHWVAREDVGGVDVRETWNRRTQRMDGTWRIDTKPGSVFRMSVRLFTPAQFRDLFDAAGLDVVRMYGHWDHSPATRTSRRTIVVGRRR